MLQIKLEHEMKNKGFSTRQVAKEIGVSHTTILRALRGEVIDLATILKLSEWLGVKPATLINSLPEKNSALSDQIALLLENNQILEKEFRKAIEAVSEGRIELLIIEDIAAYAAYKINMTTS